MGSRPDSGKSFLKFPVSDWSNYQWKRRLPLIDIWPGSTTQGVQATSRQLQSDVWQMNLFQCAHSWMLNLWICHFIRLCMYLPVKASFQPRLTCFRAARRATCDALHRSNVDWLNWWWLSGLEQGRKRQQISPGMMQKNPTYTVCCMLIKQLSFPLGSIKFLWSDLNSVLASSV